MKILVINCGSSSLKFQLIDMTDESVLAKGNVERIGITGSFMKYQKIGSDKITIEKEVLNHSVALKMVIDMLLDANNGVIKGVDEISAVGHRVVHGGEHFNSSVVINDVVEKVIEECIELAPIHNPPNLTGIRACKELMPNVPMVGVFDTAFHASMQKHVYMYALPYELYDKYKIRRYGFHGTSHNYVFNRACEMLGKDPSKTKAVTCHLGNGASICAVLNGKSVDTSLGYTPLAGLPMGTRCGNIDPAIVPILMEKEGLSTSEVNDLMNKKSGMLGLSCISNDFRDIEEAAQKGDEKANLALDVFCYRVKEYICAYAGLMNGLDMVIFTAGVGEMSDIVREKVTNGLDFIGISIDKEKNKTRGKEMDISAATAKVKTLIVPTNEELMIARETQKLVL